MKTEEECYRFFDDLCTFSEIEAMSQRFEVASLLADGKTFTQISQKIGVSSTTITRVNKCLCYGRTAISCCSSGQKKKSKLPSLSPEQAQRACSFLSISLYYNAAEAYQYNITLS